MCSIPEKESFTVVFLSGSRNISDSELLDEVVALANTFGGIIYVGIEDNGEITGINKDHYDLAGIKSLISNKIEPSLCVQTEIIEEETSFGRASVLAIRVPMSRSGLASVDGRIMGRRLKRDGSPEVFSWSQDNISIRNKELEALAYSEKLLAAASDEDSDALEISRLKSLVANNPYGDEIGDLYFLQIRYALKHLQQ